MFTGIIEEVGTIASVSPHGDGVRLGIAASTVLEDVAVGDSICVSGCCLTVETFDDTSFEVALSAETLRATASRWTVGTRVNLERALAANGRLGGHLVSGHVEGVGTITTREDHEDATILTVDSPPELARWWIPKGSVTVDGVSLTVVDVGGPGGTRDDLAAHTFTLWLIPHTLAVTTLQDLRVGDNVNLEADMLARYAARAAALAPGDHS